MHLLSLLTSNVCNSVNEQQEALTELHVKNESNHNTTHSWLLSLEARVVQMEENQKQVNTQLMATLASIQEKLDQLPDCKKYELYDDSNLPTLYSRTV
jgi:hypothetical protein